MSNKRNNFNGITNRPVKVSEMQEEAFEETQYSGNSYNRRIYGSHKVPKFKNKQVYRW